MLESIGLLIKRALALEDFPPLLLIADSSLSSCDCLRELYQALENARYRTKEPTCRRCVIREAC